MSRLTSPSLRTGCALLVAALLTSCRCDSPGEKTNPTENTAEEVPRTEGLSDIPTNRSLIEELGNCRIYHDGQLIDTGAKGGAIWRGLGRAETEEHTQQFHGKSYAEISERKINYHFWLDEDVEELHIATQARAGGVSRVSAYVDQRALGTIRLHPSEFQSAQLHVKASFSKGHHQLTFRSVGKPNGLVEHLYDLAYLRIGQNPLPAEYLAPTANNILVDVEIAKTTIRSIAPPGSSSIRCPVEASDGRELKLSAGIWGEGAGELQIFWREEGSQPTELHREALGRIERSVVDEKAPPLTWKELRVNLPQRHRLGELEFITKGVSAGSRIALGNPQIIAKLPDSPNWKARRVLMIVLGDLDRSLFPPWSPASALPNWRKMANRSYAFDRYQLPSPLHPVSFASLISGERPEAHGLIAPGYSLAPQIPRLPRALRELGVDTAFFSAVPTSAAVYGFDSDWESYESNSPKDDVPANYPLRKASEWFRHHDKSQSGKNSFALVHLRGAHPPWDIDNETASQLAPENYVGTLRPRRGAITLREMRLSKRHHGRMLKGDQERMQALIIEALKQQDRAIGELITQLEESELWRDTMVIIAGDMGYEHPPAIPFSPEGSLSLERLSAPLWIHLPGQAELKTLRSPIGPTDLHHLIRVAFGEDSSHKSALAEIFADQSPVGKGLQLSLSGDQMFFRASQTRLVGTYDSLPSICLENVDPSCSTNRFSDSLIAAPVLWSMLSRYAAHNELLKRADDAPELKDDEEFANILRVWGH